jgi:hypothetical protein
MSVSPGSAEALAERVAVSDTELQVDLTDGRRIAVPLAWFPDLLQAAPAARSHWELLGDGEGIRWPDIDADISVRGLLAGIRPGYSAPAQ